MIPELAFVPEEKVLEYFNELIEWEFSTENKELDEEKNEESEKLAAYFEDNYIGRIVRNNQRKNTLFPVKIWNCCEMIENNLPITNNSVEDCHRSFAELIAVIHPTIWKFLNYLRAK
jgi:hypothetical protein